MSLHERLAAGGFAVTAKISPPRGAGTQQITATAALLKDWVDAVNVTDNQGSHVRLASWAGSLAVIDAGLEPVMQMTCRDRNRIALQSDLLGACALGIRNAGFMQIDEPFLAGYPEHVELAVEAVNTVTDGVAATWALHVCYGNRYARPSWEGHYDFLFPAVQAARVDQLVLEFARKGLEDLRLLREWDRWLGFGVIDVKTAEVETPEVVADRIRRALEYVPADRLMINPDCGLRHLAPEVARAKLHAMVAGAATVRTELAGGDTT